MRETARTSLRSRHPACSHLNGLKPRSIERVVTGASEGTLATPGNRTTRRIASKFGEPVRGRLEPAPDRVRCASSATGADLAAGRADWYVVEAVGSGAIRARFRLPVTHAASAQMQLHLLVDFVQSHAALVTPSS